MFEVENALQLIGVDVPESDGVVDRCGEEVVGRGLHREGRDSLGVAFEVADESVVMRRKIANIIYRLSAAGYMIEVGESNILFSLVEAYRMDVFLWVNLASFTPYFLLASVFSYCPVPTL